jgi:hypothetical protein
MLNPISYYLMKTIRKAFPGFSFSFFCLMAIAIIPVCTHAQGDLVVMPKRVVFEGGKKAATLSLANIGKDTATFVISLIHIRMKEDGTFENISTPDPGQNFADKNLRLFPRNVTLAPNEAQTVKVQVTKWNDLQQGEYRSHIYFRAVPKEKPLGEKEAGKDSSFSVRLVPVYGISIPAIIRVGESDAKASLSDASFQYEKDTLPVLKVKFTRKGNMSVYGDVFVDHISNDGKISRVANIKGMAIYTPNKERLFHLMLDKTKGIDYHSGKLHVVYADQSAKVEKLAEQIVLLQ